MCAGAALALAGCGGGGGGSSAPAGSQPPATTSQPFVIAAPGPGTYAVTEIVPLPGDVFSDASGVNGSGQVVGHSSHTEGSDCPPGGACSAGGIVVTHSYYFDGAAIAPLKSRLNLVSGLNDSGTVAGNALTGSGATEAGVAGLSYGSSLTLCGTLTGDNMSTAYAVNNREEAAVVSYHYVNGNSVSHPAFYQNGTLSALATLVPGEGGVPSAINSGGQIAGSCALDASLNHAVLWSGGQVTDLGTLPGANSSEANALNDAGQVVGSSGTNGEGGRAVLYSNGTVTDLGTLPGGHLSSANGINQAGAIAGQSELAVGTAGSTTFHAVLWRGGQIIDLNPLIAPNSGWVLTNATGINNAGQVCGDGTYKGQQCAFLLTPH